MFGPEATVIIIAIALSLGFALASDRINRREP